MPCGGFALHCAIAVYLLALCYDATGTYKLSVEQLNDKGVWLKIAAGGGDDSDTVHERCVRMSRARLFHFHSVIHGHEHILWTLLLVSFLIETKCVYTRKYVAFARSCDTQWRERGRAPADTSTHTVPCTHARARAHTPAQFGTTQWDIG